MNLQQIVSSPCGIRYVVDALDIQSGAARRMLMEREMMTDQDSIRSYYKVLHTYVDTLREPSNSVSVKNLQFRLQGLKDIRTTLQNLSEGRVLDDIELFEIKHLAMLNEEIIGQISQLQLPCELHTLEDVVDSLDPEGLRIATFYVYDAYSPLLSDLRRKAQQQPDNEQLFNAIQEEEAVVRTALSKSLRPYASALQSACKQIADIDIRIAQAMQIVTNDLCIPALSDITEYTLMWHPEVKAALKKKGKDYQPVSICFGTVPTILTGSNMGGKTVVLKTIALCQFLTQFGFGIPAHEAHVAIKDQILFSMADGQSVEAGLSSFAAEMRTIHEIIRTARSDTRMLALIDEPARTTNPIEGTALVSALIDVMKTTNQSVVLVTHYTVDAHDCPCLRVSGLKDGQMDFSLIPTQSNEVPHEALHIAEQLGIDETWIEKTKQILN